MSTTDSASATSFETAVADPTTLGMCPTRLTRVTSWLNEQVDGGRLAGAGALIGRRGEVGYFETAGHADREGKTPFARNTIARIFSMTKPVTTVASMMLYEQGAFQLDDPITKYIPAFLDTRVWTGGDADVNSTVPVDTPITVRHLMTHTSGLTYGFMHTNVVDKAYRDNGIEFPGAGGELEQWIERLAELPLICQPGSQWNYSVASDVLGRLVEVWSGLSLAEYFQQAIFAPLEMRNTGFHVTPENHQLFASLYGPERGGGMSNVAATSTSEVAADRGGLKLLGSCVDSRYLNPASLYSGGGGLVGNMSDYARFSQMLLNDGELNGARLLSPTTVRFMRRNQLPDNRDMAAMGQPVWSETSYDGIGFGLGWAVVLDPVKAHLVTSVGEHHWGGAASTFFWLDPEEDLYVIFFTQLMPSSTYPIRRELRTRVYQSLID